MKLSGYINISLKYFICQLKFTPFISRLLLLSQMGLLNRWITTFLPPPYRCSAPLISKHSENKRKLNLNDLSSAFLLYGIGVAASIVTFFFERIFYSCWRNIIQAKMRPTRNHHSTSRRIESSTV